VEIRTRQLLAPLLAILLIACAAAPVASAAPQPGQAGAATASTRTQESAKLLRGGARKQSRAAQRRRARQAKRRRQARAAQRRLLRAQRRAKRRSALGKQVAVNAKAPTENPEILFRGDFEAGFDAWHLQALSHRATLFSSGTFQGAGAARFEVADGDVEPQTGSERSEVSGPTFDEGQDLYIRDTIRVGAGNSFDGPWQIIQQLHEEDWDGSPGMAVFLDEGDTLRLGAGDGSPTFWESGQLQRERWYDLVYRVFLSQDPGAGFVEVWLDGVPQRLENGQTRIYGQTIQAAQTYIKAGIYRSKSSTGTSVVDHDAILVGTSLAAVAAG